MSDVIQAPANMTAVLIDRHIAETKGDEPALRYGEKRYTYHDVAALMNRAGNMLRRLGVGAGETVVLAVAPSPALIAGLLGAMKIGAVPLVVPREEDGSLPAVVAAGEVAAIIADASRVEAVRPPADGTLVVVGDPVAGGTSFVEAMRESASSLAGHAVAQDAGALAVLRDGRVVAWSHGDLAHAEDRRAIGAIDGWDLGAALRALARCDEVTVPRQGAAGR